MNRRGYLSALIWRDPLTQEFLKQAHPDRSHQQSSDAERAWKLYRQQQDRLRRKWGAEVRPLPPAPGDPQAERYFGLGADHETNYFRELVAKRDWTMDEHEWYLATMFRLGAPAVSIEVQDELPQFEFTVNDGCMTSALLEKMRDLHTQGLSWWSRGGCPASEGHVEPCRIQQSQHGSVSDAPQSLTIKVPLVRFVPRSSEHGSGIRSDPLAGLTPSDVRDIGRTVVRLVRAALRHVPVGPARTTDAGLLAGLRHATSRSFQRALAHYDAYVERGLTIRDISRERRYGEDTVLRDVKLIWEAIHREEFHARRRRLDAPASGARHYHCESHPAGDCSMKCLTLRAWYRDKRRALPTDQTGIGMSGLKRVSLERADVILGHDGRNVSLTAPDEA